MLYKFVGFKSLILIFFFFQSLNSYSIENNDFFNKKFCTSVDPEYFREPKILEEISIETNNSKKWAKNLFSLILDLNSSSYKTSDTNFNRFQIDKKYKNKFKSNVTFKYKNSDFICKSKAQVEITGNLWLHLDWVNGYPFSSMKVSLENGHINNNINFKLLLPKSRSDYKKNINLELFVTTLLNKLGLLAPTSSLVSVKVNGNKYSKYLLQEELGKEFIESRDLVEGPLLEGDQRFTTEQVSSYKWKGELGLAKIINSSYSIKDKSNTKLSFYALSVLNNIFIDSDEASEKLRRCYNNFVTINKNKYLKDSYELRTNQLYEALIFATQTYHGFTCDDRKFYFDPIRKILLPIYNDGKSSLDYNNSTNTLPKATINAIEGASDALNQLNHLDNQLFFSELRDRGFDLDYESFKKIKDKVISNLEYLDKLDKIEVYKSQINYFKNIDSNYFGKEIKLVFYNIQNNILDVCDFKIQNCDSIKIKENFEEVHKDLLSQNFKKLKDKEILNKDFLYLFLSLDKNYSFIDNIYKQNDDLSFQVQNINNEFTIEHNESIKIFVDYKNKIINFLLLNENGRAKILGKNIKNWSFNLDGEKYLINNKDIKPSKSFNMLTGCVTFLDVNLEDVNISSKSSLCEDSVNFIRTTGSINKLIAVNSISDAVDFDFSKVLIKYALINTAKNDCLDLSYGNYEVHKVILGNCGDKGISVGEKSQLFLKNTKIKISDVGIASKDSSKVIIDEATIEANVCFAAYRKKQEFSGGMIYYKNLDCKGKVAINQKGSIIKKNES